MESREECGEYLNIYQNIFDSIRKRDFPEPASVLKFNFIQIINPWTKVYKIVRTRKKYYFGNFIYPISQK